MSQAPPSADSVRVQVEALRKKLLDLTMRNRMLNYRPSKRIGITIVGEDSFCVHRLLVEEGKKMSFVGRPDPKKSDAGRSGELFSHEDAVAMEQFREAAEDELAAYLENPAMPVDQMDTKLNTDDYESVLQAKLRMISREAVLANEELGINTLFLTLGTLEWSEEDGHAYRAPLIFVPVLLEKQANGSMRLVHDGSDFGTNLPLRTKLNEFNLKLPEMDDDKSLLDYFSQVESTVRNRTRWQVNRDDICLGFFNYEKYAMYVDLGGDAWPEGQKPWQNPDVVSMLSGGYSSPDSPVTDDTHLDELRPVSVSHEVYDADSSQTIAMIRAAEGLSMVVEGPPGTGKSQTITNIIAEAVAAGKSVLFVSAKRAALQVVKRNLEKADLGAMCLDLHDKLTNRREFYAEIKRTVSKSLSVKSEEALVARLTELRIKLNQHSAAVNEPLPQFGTPPFRAMCILASLPGEQPEDRDGRIPFAELAKWKDSDIKSALPIIEALQKRLKSIGRPIDHPFWGTSIDYLDPAKRLDLTEEFNSAKAALTASLQSMTDAAELLRVDVPITAENVRVLRICTDQALSAPPHDGVALRTSTWKEQEGAIREVIDALHVRRDIRSARSGQLTTEAWTADFVDEQFAYDRYAHLWHKWFLGSFREAQRKLTPFLTANSPKHPIELRDLLRHIRECRRAEEFIHSKDESMRRLLGVQWLGLDTDPDVIERLLIWIVTLHDKVSAGELPDGLLDFFEGKHDNSEISSVVAEAEQTVAFALTKYRGAAELLGYKSSDATHDEIRALLSKISCWEENLHRLPEFMAYNELKRQALERSLHPIIQVAERWPLAAERLRETFLRSYYSGVVRSAMESRPELKVFEREGHEGAVREFRELDDFKLKYNRAQVRLSHQRRLPSFDNALGNLHILKMQCELQRKHKPIRWAMSRAGEAIQRIKPVFMMSPLSVAIHLPPELPLFDLVIFDEASQIKPEDSLCAIVRAKQCVVVGDTRQMPPTSFFDRLIDDDDLSDDSPEAEIGNEARKLESVLSLMSAVTMGRVRRPDLRWHYRSIHPSLIQPSNEMFYENRLIVFPSSGVHQNGELVGVVFHHLPDTIYEAGSRFRINRIEAETVANHVLEHVRRCPEQSLLVAAMNKPQADLIYTEVQKRERLDPQAFKAYHELHPHEPLDIKNLENVQGDERDVVFISVTYGRDATGTLRQHFGPLLLDGGERRLNVLITRARMRCEVFSNITSDDIRLDTPKPGVQAFKRYLRFAKEGISDIPTTSGMPEESPFEEEVTAALRDHGYVVHTQVGTEGYRIDIGVIDPSQPGRYLIGVECDGATYHQARSARDRDKLRQRVLEARGWTLHRIWSHDWWQDRDGEIRRLVKAIEDSRETSKKELGSSDDEQKPVVLEELQATSSSAAATRPYLEAPTPRLLTSAEELGSYMVKVVEAEGPIHTDLLLIRLRDAAGYGRAGSNVRAWLDDIIAQHTSKVKVIMDSYYSENAQLWTPRDWSQRPAAEKKADLVSNVEIAAAIRAVVGAAFGISDDEACKSAFMLIGFRRVTEAAMRRGLVVLKLMLSSGGLIRKANGLLALPPATANKP